MREREGPITETIKAPDARSQWSKLLNEVSAGKKRVLIEKGGIPLAAIIPAHDLQRLERFEAQREEDFEALWRTGEAFKDESPEEIEREVKKAVAAARRKLRREAQQHANKP